MNRLSLSFEFCEHAALYESFKTRKLNACPWQRHRTKKEPRKESKCDRAAEQLSWLSRPIWTSPDSQDPLPTCWPDASRTRDVNLNAEHKTQGSDAKRQKDDKAKHIGQSDKNDKVFICLLDDAGWFHTFHMFHTSTCSVLTLCLAQLVFSAPGGVFSC